MIQMSNKRYKSLLYWANVGYGAKGKEYTEKYPKRKDPWYKINDSILVSTVEEKLSKYIIEAQSIVSRGIKVSYKKNTEVDTVTRVYHKVSGELISILLKGYDVLRGAASER